MSRHARPKATRPHRPLDRLAIAVTSAAAIVLVPSVFALVNIMEAAQ